MGQFSPGFTDAEYNEYGYKNADMATVVETVTGQLDGAYRSLLRQHAERSNLYKGQVATEPTRRECVAVVVTIEYLGRWVHPEWLVLLGVLLVGSLVGTVQTCMGGTLVKFDAQDVVRLFACNDATPQYA